VNSYTILVQAALEGQGFALIGPPLVQRFLSNGTLIQPVNARPVVRHAFHLLLPRLSIPSAAAQAFADWIKGSFPAKASIEGKIELDGRNGLSETSIAQT
jgi:LysR family glycine cleavage system transcriptional activator